MLDTRKLMSEAKFYEAYARFDDDKGRYETFPEAVARVMDMHRKKYAHKMSPALAAVIAEAQEAYAADEVLGAQRALQFGGDIILKNNLKMYNCTASHASRPAFFGEYAELLLSGCGVGFSVQKHHVAKLPPLTRRTDDVKKFVVPDSIEGWAEAFDVLFSSFFSESPKVPEYQGVTVHFDFSEIRPKGAYITGGFKAPGPEPLRLALQNIERVLHNVSQEERKMRTIEVYDTCMFIADAVISGGVRRSATICLFSRDDQEMMKAKTGDWWLTNKQRERSNNSAVLLRSETTYEDIKEIMESVKQFGEPGFIFTDCLEYVYNPCVEVGMLPFTEKGFAQYKEFGYADVEEVGFQGCNLTEINGAKCTTPEKFYAACRNAAILGTLQAGYTDFPYLSEASRKIYEREALIGVGITGFMNNPEVLFDQEVLRKGARIVKQTNMEVAALIGINPAARTTVVKPAGNSSVKLGTASGIHAEYAAHYIRYVTMDLNDEVAQLIQKHNPSMIARKNNDPADTTVYVAFPITAPENSIFSNDVMGAKQLAYVKLVQQSWIEEGTNAEFALDPNLRHNVSNTVYVDNWDEVIEYVAENKQWFCGISFMSSFGDKAFYRAPFTQVLTAEELIAKYGDAALFASGLITRGVDAFEDNLWKATATAMGMGENLEVETHANMAKRDWVRMFKKFAESYFNNDTQKTSDLLKDVYNLHLWVKITSNLNAIDWAADLKQKKYVEVDTLGAIACSGGVCDLKV